MIYESLIAPTESPTTLLEIKRALLTYDKIKLIDPNDRDVIPPETYTNIITGTPTWLMGFYGGPIRPMGKTIGYDDIFEKIIEQCKPAIKQGLVEVIQTYRLKPKTNTMYILSDVTGGYPLDIDQVFFIYRGIASNQEFLTSAIKKTEEILLKGKDNYTELITKGLGDYSIPNLNLPELPKLVSNNGANTENADFLTAIARSRIAAIVKYSGYCEHKNIVRIFNGDVYEDTILNLLKNTENLLSDSDDDKFWIKRNRILNLCHEEYLDESKLEKMSIEEVLKLRTTAWGKQAESREKLFNSIRSIALEEETEDIFQNKSSNLISKYTKNSEELIQERENLNFKIKCELGKAALGIPSTAGAIFSQIGSPTASIGLALAAGGVWCFDKAKEYIPTLREITAKEKKEMKGAGFAINNFYSKLKAL